MKLPALSLLQDHELGAPLRLTRWRWRGARREQRFEAAAGTHPRWELSWCTRGDARYRIGQRELQLAPGDLIVVPAGLEHATTFVGDVLAASIKVSDARLRAVLSALDTKASARLAILSGDDARRAADIGNMCLAEAKEGRGAELAIDALCEAMLVTVLRSFCGASDDDADETRRLDPRIAASVQQIRDAFDQPLTVETLARTAGMSRYHFSRAFKAQLGHSPYAFLTETRLLRAAATLRRKRDVPVTVAALEAGFSDLGRFARAFRRRFGATPTRYRAAAGEVS